MDNKHTKVIRKSIHVVFEETDNGLTSTFSFDKFQLSKYADDEHEEAQEKCNHQNVPINVNQCLN